MHGAVLSSPRAMKIGAILCLSPPVLELAAGTAQGRYSKGVAYLWSPPGTQAQQFDTSGFSRTAALRKTNSHCRDALAEYLFNAIVKSKTRYKHKPSVPCSLLHRAKENRFHNLGGGGKKVEAVPLLCDWTELDGDPVCAHSPEGLPCFWKSYADRKPEYRGFG